MVARALALVVFLAAVACGPPSTAAPCTGDNDCTLEGGGRCLASPLGVNACAYPDPACAGGYHWGDLSGAIAGQCVGGDADAGIDAVDSRQIDATDAPTDAGPSSPIVSNYQPADLVIGQAGFTAPTADRGFAANSVNGDALAATATSLWVVDGPHARVLQFAPLPTLGDPSASSLVGRPSLTDGTTIGAASASNLGTSLYSVATDGNVLVVADAARHRVLIWSPAPTSPGAAANLVLGQPDFTTTTSGTGANQMRTPGCVWTNGTMLVVCDTFNHRVLVWTSFPTTNGQAANLVLGQAGFGAAVDPPVATATTISRPFGALVSGTRLYVADDAFNRVLVWDPLPSTNNEAADIVLGQSTLTGMGDLVASPTSLSHPRGLATYRDALLVADPGHNRVVVYQPIPVSSGAAAALVLGQPDLDTENMVGALPTQRDFRGVSDIAVTGSSLFVGDPFARRVLRFTMQ